MKARPLTHLIVGICVVWMFSAESEAQLQNRSPRSFRNQVDQQLDLDKIWGRCGCDTCNGRLEHNEPYEDEKDGDGSPEFQLVNRWTGTAMSGGGLSQGDPTILTWSIIPDGTDANGGPGFVPSNLIARFDTIFNEPNAGTSDLTNRLWHSLMEQSFERWGELSGLEYFYEPNDDGLSNFGAGGVVGVRGDCRCGGFNIDGPSGVLGFNQFPNVGDMALDTSETGIFGNASLGYRLFRNVVTHGKRPRAGIRSCRIQQRGIFDGAFYQWII